MSKENEVNILVKYVKDPKTKKSRGVLVAIDKNRIGMSLCNPTDKWNSTDGRLLAAGRAALGINFDRAFPDHGTSTYIRKAYDSFCEEAKVHFSLS